MKKIYLVIIALTLLVSCSSDDSGGASSEPVLLKRYTNSSSNGALTSWDIEYEGNRQMKIKAADGVDHQDCFYTNDLVTNIKTFKGNSLQYESILEYNQAGKLTKHIILQDSKEVLNIDITYPSENVYVETAYITSTQEVVATTYTLLNGNIIKEESGNKLVEYEYDTKNVPKKNVQLAGIFQIIQFDSYNEYNANNCVRKTTYFDGQIVENITQDYTYNSDNYPITRKSFYNGYLNNVTTFYYK